MKQRQEIDLSLIRDAKEGKQHAYTELFKHYHRTIQYYIYQSVNNTEDAEDLTIVTFEKAFTNLDKYLPNFEFQTWLSKIAKNTVIDFIVWKNRRPTNLTEINDAHTFHHLVETPEERFINKELGERLDTAINKLQNSYKDIVKLRYYDDLDYSEISSRLGIGENHARSQMCRAKKCLSVMNF